jgi:signal peptide peptidase SppA
LSSNFDAALEDKDVKAILFDIDSPGGEAIGINEFSEKIYKARGQKPIKAYVGGTGCSAAYWIASAADEIVADPTAILGSIGVIATIRDEDEKDAKQGVKNIRIVSSKSPNKRPDLSTDEGLAVVRQNIDAIADIFINTVARNRSSQNAERMLNGDLVVEKFGRGGTLIGAEAVKVGMCDRLGSFEDVLASFKEAGTSTRANTSDGEVIMSKTYREKLLALFDEADAVKAGAEHSHATLNAEEGVAASEETLKPNANPEPEERDGFELVRAEDGTVVRDESGNPVYKEKNEMAEPNVEVAALQQQLADAQAAIEAANTEKNNALAAATAALELAMTAEAKTIALGLKHESKLDPAQEAKFVTAYVRASLDDKANPVEGFNRVENLMALYSNKTVTNMTEDQLEPNATTVLLSERLDTSDLKKLYEQIDAQAEKFAAEVNTSGKPATRI